jgi:hypothetical protein
MVARNRLERIGVGALGVGLGVGATVGLLTAGPGTASPRAAGSTTSSVGTTTVPAAPSTTAAATPAPSVIEFSASPTSAVCGRDQQQMQIVLIWSTQGATSVTLEADGSTLADGQPPTGRYPVAFACPAAGAADRHEVALTASGQGTTSSTPIAVAIAAAGANGGGHGRSQDGGGDTSG